MPHESSSAMNLEDLTVTEAASAIREGQFPPLITPMHFSRESTMWNRGSTHGSPSIVKRYCPKPENAMPRPAWDNFADRYTVYLSA